MKKTIKILLLTLIFGISSCSSSFIVSTKKKTIRLQPLPENSIKVGIDNGIFEIKFNKNDLIEQFQKDLKEWMDPRLKSYAKDLNSLEFSKIYNKHKMDQSQKLGLK